MVQFGRVRPGCCCGNCDDFPDCLDGSTLTLNLAGFADVNNSWIGFGPFNGGECGAPGATLTRNNAETCLSSNINGSYQLEHVGGANYFLQVTEYTVETPCEDTHDSPIKVWEFFQTLECDPTSGSDVTELEWSLNAHAIQAELSCVDGRMHLASWSLTDFWLYDSHGSGWGCLNSFTSDIPACMGQVGHLLTGHEQSLAACTSGTMIENMTVGQCYLDEGEDALQCCADDCDFPATGTATAILSLDE